MQEVSSPPPITYIIDGMRVGVRAEYARYLGKELSELQGVAYPVTIRKLEAYEAHTRVAYNLSALDTLFILHHHDKSITQLAAMLSISNPTLCSLFDKLGLPRLSNKEATRRFLASIPSEQLSERTRAYNAILTPEQRKQRATSAKRALTPEQRREYGSQGRRAFEANTTPEQRREYTRIAGFAAQAAFTPEQKERRKQLARQMALSYNAM